MTPEPLVSTAIATFNRPTLVARAIRSVLRQTVQDFEILVVDDGAVQSAEAAVRQFGDPRIRYIRHERNQGLPAARNTAIRAARGRYMAFLDDDDEWLEQKLEKQLPLLDRYEAILCAAFVDDRRTVKRFARNEITAADLRRGNSFDPSTLLARTAVIRDLGFDPSLRVGEDWDAFIRLAQRGRMGYVREPLIIYTSAGQERMTTEAVKLSLMQLEQRMSMLHKHRKFFGQFWFNYHVAAFLLSHLPGRADKYARIRYAIGRCGVAPVARLLLDKLMRHGGGVLLR